MRGQEQQTSIYVAGVSGRRPRVPTDATLLEERARAVMSDEAFAYVAGGAGTGATMRANRAAFDRWRIVPRMLRDVSERDSSVELFGRTLPAPFLVAPIGVLEMAHREAERAVARAVRDEGVPMVYSNQASVPMEEVSALLGDSPRWFQLYWSTRDELVESFVRRAEACGCEAIVVTLDTTLLGWRTRDLDLGWLPFLRGMGIAQYTSDPVFTKLLSERADGAPQPEPKPSLAALRTLIKLTRNYPEAFLPALRSGRARAAVQRFVQIYSRPSLSWDDLPFLRERTKLPIVLKGILHADDARRAVDEGIDGIVVSNHGGRQVDGAIATLDALPAIAAAVDGRIPVLLDSGIRSGADIFKALALGARAVLLGRPHVYGLALAGEAGVREVLTNFIADFDLTMGLAGCRSVSEITAETLVPAPGAGAGQPPPRQGPRGAAAT
ncbi:MAG: lactate 2-monooxygenase [Thermoleophilaceae bacterium]|jgi:lactate 2-monooxygenase|nr:lactate 2-monooxygenase [Thermoleophilaceae bacterium]